jgi:basic membrane protein A
MRKIVFYLFLAGIIVTSAFFTACPRREAAAPARAAAAMPSVMLLTDASGIDDRSFNAAAWRGILEFYGDTWTNQRQRGTYYETVTATTMDMYIPNLRQATDEAWDLVVATGFTWADALGTVAGQNPNQSFLIVDVDWVGHPNVMQATFSEHEGSFLVGVAAALKAQADGVTDPIFGFIGGVPGPVITRFHVGYVQGVLHILPNARFVDYYANAWGRPDLAMTQARHWYDQGVFIIYSAAGATGNGTIAQAREYRLQGRNVWAIGVDSDQHDEGIYSGASSAVLTSMLKRVESSLLYALRAIQNNTFAGRTIVFDLAAEGVGFSTTNPAMTQDIVRRVNSIRDDIIAGRIRVAATNAEARRLPGFPQDLRALDN